MEKNNLKIEDEKIYPVAADDIYDNNVKAATCEMNLNPRNSEEQR